MVALAQRLDTPTAAATATAVADAAANAEVKVAMARRAAAAEGKLTTPEDNPNNDNDESSVVEDYCQENLPDQSPDAEVLPRGWQVTDGAPVYNRSRSSATDGVSHGSLGDDNIPYYSRRRDTSSSSPRGDGSNVHFRRKTHGGRSDGGLSYNRHRRRGVLHEEGEIAGGPNPSTRGATTSAAGKKHNEPSASLSAFSERAQGQGLEQIHWREITKERFDLLLLIDSGAELGSSRVLLTMPEYGLEEEGTARRVGRKPGGLYICPSMAEYYLLLSVYFGEVARG